MVDNYTYKTKVINSKEFLFDELRKKWIQITPEEKVRQFFWKYLHYEKKYPKSLIAIEKQIIVHQRKKRFDIVIYNKNGNAHILIECKSPTISLNENSLNQLVNYQSSVKAKYLIITNGKATYCLEIDQNLKKAKYLNDIPTY